MLAYFKKMQRQKAIATAQKNAKTLIADGYRFVPVSRGFFDVIRPNETIAAYQIQLFRSPGTDKLTYTCSCKFFEPHGMCKHGDGLILHVEAVLPLVACASDAPSPDNALYVVAGLAGSNAVDEKSPATAEPCLIRMHGLIWEPVITIDRRFSD